MTRQILLIAFGSILLSGCYSTKKTIAKAQPYSEKINWPEDYLPKDADFYVHNMIQVNAKPEEIWNLLVNAEDWPNWYEGMTNVKVLNSEESLLESDTKLKFSTMGQDFDAIIREYEPYQRLAWETKNEKLGAYHAWLIIPNEKGCVIVTDEVQKGKLAKLQRIFLPNKLRKLHDTWLQGFKEKAENYAD